MRLARPALLAATAILLSTLTAQAKGPTHIDPEKAAKADPDFSIQGEYAGEMKTESGPKKAGVQVIALGGGKFEAVGYTGGLPGAGWNQEKKPERVQGSLRDGKVVFEGKYATGTIQDGVMKITGKGGEPMGQLKRIERKSPTLGAKPPEGAVVLFDGKSADEWSPRGGKQPLMTQDGLLTQGVISKRKFGSHKLHIEFRLPYQPQNRGQGRGNSGIYVQGRYEVQMLDSFGLEGKHNECGGIYSVKNPDVNMCLPPLTWQTYDIDYTAAKFDDAGKLVSPPRMTVKHNGVLIHDNVELPGNRNTTAAPNKPGPQPGPIYLQNHGNPVRYRNIWVVEKQEK